jgi:hypothetical protein
MSIWLTSTPTEGLYCSDKRIFKSQGSSSFHFRELFADVSLNLKVLFLLDAVRLPKACLPFDRF